MYALFSAETTIWWFGLIVNGVSSAPPWGLANVAAFLPKDNELLEKPALGPKSERGGQRPIW
jgi:hypothetical protein